MQIHPIKRAGEQGGVGKLKLIIIHIVKDADGTRLFLKY